MSHSLPQLRKIELRLAALGAGCHDRGSSMKIAMNLIAVTVACIAACGPTAHNGRSLQISASMEPAAQGYLERMYVLVPGPALAKFGRQVNDLRKRPNVQIILLGGKDVAAPAVFTVSREGQYSVCGLAMAYGEAVDWWDQRPAVCRTILVSSGPTKVIIPHPGKSQ